MLNFSDLKEREILALAISLEEQDARIYDQFAEGLREPCPAGGGGRGQVLRRRALGGDDRGGGDAHRVKICLVGFCDLSRHLGGSRGLDACPAIQLWLLKIP